MLAGIIFSGCPKPQPQASISGDPFGKLSDGKQVTLFTLKNARGMTARIIDYGAILVSLTAPNRDGIYEDIMLGYDNLQDYEADKSFFGGIVGRYGNRIGKGRFVLDGQSYQLTINNGENHLHGGITGFNKVMWQPEITNWQSKPALKMRYISPDGEQGYPGEVDLTVFYQLSDENELRIEYQGTTNKPTILNPTNHGYFNLTGSALNTILEHQLMIASDQYTPVDSGLITTGELSEVTGTPMDFRTPTAIGAHVNDNFEQLKFGKGYDHNWVLLDFDQKVRKVASLYDPYSGRLMDILTDQPGLQFYSGNFLDGSITGKDGITYKFRTGLCLEAQCFPDTPNKPHFPSVTLRPGETYRQTTIYRFLTR